ncbi:hypothetical protein NPIL_115121 [Nephila pilipes]|uniref:Uncharacterized protein n=1 Tax=Nephila pilipes TaxID=299642 RepID=A0A8X6ICR5_NEPPI|nr:hypothetical protein NPIL_115121 [Nephila pilipes]
MCWNYILKRRLQSDCTAVTSAKNLEVNRFAGQRQPLPCPLSRHLELREDWFAGSRPPFPVSAPKEQFNAVGKKQRIKSWQMLCQKSPALRTIGNVQI